MRKKTRYGSSRRAGSATVATLRSAPYSTPRGGQPPSRRTPAAAEKQILQFRKLD